MEIRKHNNNKPLNLNFALDIYLYLPYVHIIPRLGKVLRYINEN